jgi:hypothetical protein
MIFDLPRTSITAKASRGLRDEYELGSFEPSSHPNNDAIHSESSHQPLSNINSYLISLFIARAVRM